VARAIDKLLVANSIDNLAESWPNEVDQKMKSLGIVAMAIVIHDTICMYVSMPLLSFSPVLIDSPMVY
jgi:hypothetical protein